MVTKHQSNAYLTAEDCRTWWLNSPPAHAEWVPRIVANELLNLRKPSGKRWAVKAAVAREPKAGLVECLDL